MGNNNLPIGVLDSGVGGLTVVKELIISLPNENVVYFGDSKRMPYGNKTEEEIVILANNIISFLEDKGVKGILLACNTVSSQIQNLQSKVPIFGIIEAGCLAAIETSKSQEIGLIATVATVKSKIYESILKDLAPGKKILSNDSRKLPKIINDHLEDRNLLDIHIRECINPIMDKGFPSELILGCSHFPIIQDEIQELYPNLKLINPANKQVLMIKKYLEENQLLNDENKRKVEIYSTEGIDEFRLTLERLKIKDYSLDKVKLFKDD
ncbi:glutamate racemase [Alkalibaculum sporogenes]|uniref:glutamate racemase n=1 Tax=Alkalibaculum sporogenes TaxID=2655001 RepID=UPI00187B3C81|nr:glutamate racemase [Alkalibaculum sporogenes]